MTEFVVAGAKVFDGERPLGEIDVHVAGEVIRAVGGSRPEGVTVIDGSGATLLPGLLRRRAKRCGMPVVSRYDGASTVDRYKGSAS